MIERIPEPRQELIPSEQPARAVDRAVKWRRTPNRAYIDIHTDKTGANTYVLKPSGKAAVRKASAGGMSIGGIARNVLGISARAFQELRQRDPEAQECVEIGRELLGDELLDLLLVAARNDCRTAQIFLARSRAGWSNDAGTLDGSPTPKVVNNTQINVTLQEPMTLEQVLSITQKALPDATAD